MTKTIKLDHQLADDIRRGEKTSTWRMYDDKNITVNDEIELVDKVDPANPATWISFGIARVDQVIEKRLEDIDDEDYQGHHKYASLDEMVAVFRAYYGSEVNEQTSIKIIHFTLQKEKNAGQARAPTIKEAKLYADGGSRGNPGPSASGFVILDMDDNIVVEDGIYLGVTTNNQAEYQALKVGLENAYKRGIRRLHIYMDSLLVINQMKGIFKVKNRDLWPIYESVKVLTRGFEQITFSHVPRELNKIADSMVNKLLDEAERSQ